MNKLCNYRPIFFICVAALSALVFSYFVLVNKAYVLFIALVLVLALAAYLFVIRARLQKKHLITLIICAVTFTVCFFSMQLAANSFTKQNIAECQVSGYISQINNNVITLTDVIADGNKLSKNVTVYYSGSTQLKAGNNIKFNASLKNLNLVSNNNINYNMIAYNIAYSTSVTSVEVLNYKPTVQIVIKNYVYSNLIKNYSNKNAALVFGMLFGDKNYLSEFNVSSYNRIGLAHIFAVSGLHISIIFMLISFAMSAFKIRGIPNFIVTAIISILYCYLCGFTASVVRATVMSLCLLFAKSVQRQGDSFNAYCISFLILVLINPFNILLKGFQLSFLCVFAILSLSPIFTKLFSKVMPEKLALSLAVSLSAFIGTFIVLIELYGFFNPLSIIFNMFMIPIFTGIFVVIFVFNLISCLIPPLGIINQAPNFLLTIYNNLTDLLAKIPTYVNLSNLGVLCLLSFILFIFIAGNFCLLKRFKRIIASCSILILCIISAVFSVIPTSFNYISVTAIRSTYENCYLLTSCDNSRIMVVNTLNSYSVKTINEYLTEHNINFLSAIVARNNNASQTQVEQLLKQTRCKDVLTLNTSSNSTFEEYQSKTIGNIKLSVLGSTLKDNTFVATIDGEKILFCFTSLNGAQQQELINNFNEFSTICCPTANTVGLECKKYLTYYESEEAQVYSTSTQNIIKIIIKGEK